MTADDSFQPPFQSDEDTDAAVSDTVSESQDLQHDTDVSAEHTDADVESISDSDLDEAKAAWDEAENAGEPILSDEDLQRLTELAEPFVGLWNQLISTTNWEKGKIISQWREKLIQSGVPATEYSDEAWARRVGGVTSPHVGRLRRVHDRFASDYASYEGLYWSHFLAALDWEDAPMWLQGAVEEKWSVAGMRQKKWEAEGAVESNRPTSSQVVEVDLDEDVVMPAQGGGREREYDDGPDGVATGPTYEGPDFGEEEELSPMGAERDGGSGATALTEDPESEPVQGPVQPFVGLPELPDDLSDAIESLKLSLLRHKTDGWRDVEIDTVQRYLDAIGIMIRN
ncbi:hypothetical protein [Stieleria varia]|uniref:Uncharacterized protein n=1 Tax=Stieleria varia TaxID=2528005 RepID=A0A5C6A374_9BACT|nr:hypothetical protein [Stieleria varia]TWT93787.1 hypothetical protein Pla52n_56150 [Stieleria varia]